MLSFLTAFEINVLINVAVFMVTLAFSQKIKDWFSSIPSDLRGGLKVVEKDALARIKDHRTGLIAALVMPATPPPPSPAP